jgi:diacylglycerol kinase family enzyme
MRRAALIVNPRASRVTPSLITAVMAELANAGPVEKLVTERSMHASELATELGRSVDALYVLSGDGGYNEVVNGVAPGMRVGFLPGGATSVLPRALGLPRDPVAAARRLGRSSEERRISLGHVNGRRFTFCAGVGLDAELVRAVDQIGRLNGRRPGDVAFVRELGRILRRREWRIEPAMTVEGHGRVAFAIATNCDPYTYAGRLPVHATPEASFEAGVDLVGPRHLNRSGFARLAWSVLVYPTHSRSADYLYLHDADRIVVRCDAPTPLQVDGEDLGDVADVVLESERDALTVLV